MRSVGSHHEPIDCAQIGLTITVLNEGAEVGLGVLDQSQRSCFIDLSRSHRAESCQVRLRHRQRKPAVRKHFDPLITEAQGVHCKLDIISVFGDQFRPIDRVCAFALHLEFLRHEVAEKSGAGTSANERLAQRKSAPSVVLVMCSGSQRRMTTLGLPWAASRQNFRRL
jgi:hypothetical protein